MSVCAGCGTDPCIDIRCPLYVGPTLEDLERIAAEYESLDRPWWADRLMTHIRTDMPPGPEMYPNG